MDFKTILRTFLKIILPLAFGCLLLWYLYSKMDLNEIWEVIRKGVRYDIILFSLLFDKIIFVNNILKSISSYLTPFFFFSVMGAPP